MPDLKHLLETFPLNISSTRRNGTNGLRNADELIEALKPFVEGVEASRDNSPTHSSAIGCKGDNLAPSAATSKIRNKVYIHKRQLSLVDLKTYSPATMTCSSLSSATSEEAREYAYEILRIADEVDALNMEGAKGK